jgi:hypothetical protein
MSTFNRETYAASDACGKEIVAGFLRQLGFEPRTPKESFKGGDIWAYVSALDRDVIFGAEYRGTENRNPDKYPWKPSNVNHPWVFSWSTVHIPGRKSPKDSTEIEISVDSKTELNLTVVLLRDARNPESVHTDSRGLDPLSDVPLHKTLVFHRASKTSPWTLCDQCTTKGDTGEPDSNSSAYLKKVLGLTVLAGIPVGGDAIE